MVSQWIQENVLDKGVENIRFFAQMPKLDMHIFGIGIYDPNKTSWVECKVDERRYKVEEGYKITLEPVVPGYACDSYYQHDFEILARQGWILPKESESAYVKHITWGESCGQLMLIHQADIVVDDDI